MVKRLILRVRDRIELRFTAGDEVRVFTSRVFDVTPESILVDRPVIERRLFSVNPGDTLEIRYKRKDAVYRFNSRVVAESVRQGLPVLEIESPHEVERIQRREHFRIDVLLPISFKELPLDEYDEPGEFQRGLVLDLSASGVRFSTEAANTLTVWPGTTLDLIITLSDDTVIEGVSGRVIKIDRDPRDSSRSVVVCRFYDILDRDKEAIIVHNIRYQQRWRSEKLEEEEKRKGP